MNAVGRDQKIASNQNGSTGGYKLGVYSGNNMVEFEIRTAANAAVPQPHRPAERSWTAMSGTTSSGVYDKGKAIRTYVNGKLDRELATTEVAGISTGALMLGRESYSQRLLVARPDGRCAGLQQGPDRAERSRRSCRAIRCSPGPRSPQRARRGHSRRDGPELVGRRDRRPARCLSRPRTKTPCRAPSATSPLYQGRPTGTSLDLAGLVEFGGGNYFWRIDEVEADNVTIHKGLVWSFTIPGYLIVDDFESYDDAAHRIYDTWTDGYTDGKSNSIVGNWQAPFAERTIIHGGKQSMPMDYNNIVAPYFSEASLELAPVQDWTGNGVTDLSLWYRGYPIAFSDNGNGAFTVSGGGNDIWNAADAFRFAYKKLSGNGSITARVDSQTNTNAWAKAGVMIRESLDPGSPHAAVVVTPSNGVSFPYRSAAAGASLQTNSAGLTVPYWVRLTRTGNVFKAEYSSGRQDLDPSGCGHHHPDGGQCLRRPGGDQP